MNIQENEAFKAMDAVLRLIPDDNKIDYLRALETVPQIVFSESDPLKYLRFAKYDATAAALRIVEYWKSRVLLFGERAFLPLTLTGNGALSEEDISFVRSGFAQYTLDRTGGPVVIIVPSRKNSSDQSVIMRGFFYLGQVSVEDPQTCTLGGWRVVATIVEPSNLNGVAEGRRLLFRIFPGQPRSFHYFNMLPSHNWVWNKLVRGLVTFYRALFGEQLTYLDAGQPIPELRTIMELSGFSLSGLPVIMGGTWRDEDFNTWCRKRVELDLAREQAMGLLNRNARARDASGLEDNMVVDLTEAHQSSTVVAPRTTSLCVDSPLFDPTQGSAREQIERFIQSQPTDTYEGYQRACSQAVQEVWSEEVNHERFLRSTGGCITSAAQKIVNYWQIRVQTFRDKACLSLYQTGDHALGGRQDLSVLRTGFCMLLQPDEAKRPVMYVNTARLQLLSQQQSSSPASRDRCLFYMSSLLAESEESVTSGVVLLVLLPPHESSPFEKFDVNFLHELMCVLPVHVHAVHWVLPEQPTPQLRDRIEATVKTYSWGGGATHLHIGSTLTTVGTNLQQSFGIRKHWLPKELGGEWGYDMFIQWQELRTRMEWRVPLAYRGGDQQEAYNFPVIRPFQVLGEDQDAERRRRMNVINCRRKRDRKDLEIISLKEESHSLGRKNDALELENRRLQELISAAAAATEHNTS